MSLSLLHSLFLSDIIIVVTVITAAIALLNLITTATSVLILNPILPTFISTVLTLFRNAILHSHTYYHSNPDSHPNFRSTRHSHSHSNCIGTGSAYGVPLRPP